MLNVLSAYAMLDPEIGYCQVRRLGRLARAGWAGLQFHISRAGM